MGLTLDITSMKSQVQISGDLIRSNVKNQSGALVVPLLLVSLLQTTRGDEGWIWVKGLKRGGE